MANWVENRLTLKHSNPDQIKWIMSQIEDDNILGDFIAYKEEGALCEDECTPNQIMVFFLSKWSPPKEETYRALVDDYGFDVVAYCCEHNLGTACSFKGNSKGVEVVVVDDTDREPIPSDLDEAMGISAFKEETKFLETMERIARTSARMFVHSFADGDVGHEDWMDVETTAIDGIWDVNICIDDEAEWYLKGDKMPDDARVFVSVYSTFKDADGYLVTNTDAVVHKFDWWKAELVS